MVRAVISAACVNKRITVQAGLGKKQDPVSKITKSKEGWQKKKKSKEA
jgi:hypothetical protein